MPGTPAKHASRALVLLYSPAAERPVLESLLGIEDEISASVQGGLDHEVAHVRLQWWRDECARLAHGDPVHPLTRTLLDAFAPPPAVGGSALAGLAGLVDTAIWDLAAATFETRREVTAYCERWAAAMMVPAAEHAAAGAGRAGPWLAIGAAVREIQLLASLDLEARSGRLRLPVDELQRVGVDPASLAVVPCPPPLAALLGERHEALRSILMQSIARVEREKQPALRGLLVWTTLAWRQSEQAQRNLPEPHKPTRLAALSDAWAAWRTARHALATRFSLG